MRISKSVYIVGLDLRFLYSKNKIYCDFHAIVFLLLFYSFEVFKIKYDDYYIFFSCMVISGCNAEISLLMGF